MPRNTTGLEQFNKARNAVLADRGIASQDDFTQAIRTVYNQQNLRGFEGWNTARDIFLKSIGFTNGYKSLMDEAKQRNASMNANV
jgi:hypothetical protein